MHNLNYQLIQIAQTFTAFTADSGKWDTLKDVIGKLLPILWIATALVSTVWMVVKFISANFQSATGDQAKYEKAKKARKRALFAWITGCLWPVLFIVAWPIAKTVYGALMEGKAGYEPLPDLF